MPTTSVGDRAEVLSRAVLASIPIVGGAALELYNAAIQTPLQRRTEQWMENVADRLRELAVQFEDLSDRDDFLSAMIDAGRTATATSNAEKLTALRNAVVNVALQPELDEEETHYFLSLVDQLTPIALRMLVYFQSPDQTARLRGIHIEDPWMDSGAELLVHVMPELDGRDDLYRRLAGDLTSRGLVASTEFHTIGFSPRARLTTPMGDRFLRFVSEPS